ncbi:hypothetical protein [Clostridium botulinum]|uniref:hypothetical protein n=2 Tax=Clostridium botulinum TaxID=1491 RepID=UPI000A4E6C35|nr:hypothetical protein [Clostridium botulinum]
MPDLYKVIKKAKMGEDQSLESLIVKFEPIINSISWRCKSEYARTDLTIFLIKLIKNIKLNCIENLSDGALVKYIQKSLYREYYRMNKSNLIKEVELNDIFNLDITEYKDIEYEIFLNELKTKDIINERQEYILLKKYSYLNAEQEIAIQLGISRQAVNKTNRLALKKIEKYLN